MQIDIIGVPIDLGADRRGVDMGPSAIRSARLRLQLDALGCSVEDKGNLEVAIAEMCHAAESKMKYVDCIVSMARRAAGAVAASMQAGRIPLVLGGDHSVALGSINGAAMAFITRTVMLSSLPLTFARDLPYRLRIETRSDELPFPAERVAVHHLHTLGGQFVAQSVGTGEVLVRARGPASFEGGFDFGFGDFCSFRADAKVRTGKVQQVEAKD